MDLYIHIERSGVCGELSNQVQRLVKMYFIRRPPLQTFARAVIAAAEHHPDLQGALPEAVQIVRRGDTTPYEAFGGWL